MRTRTGGRSSRAGAVACAAAIALTVFWASAPLLAAAPGETPATRAAGREIDELRDRLLAGIPPPTLDRASTAARDVSKAASAVSSSPTLALVLALTWGRNAEILASREILAGASGPTGTGRPAVPPDACAGLDAAVASPDALRQRLEQSRTCVARLEFLTTARSTLNDAARRYEQVRFADRAVNVLRANRTLVVTMEKTVLGMVQAGLSSQADLLKAQSELARVDSVIETLRSTRAHELARLCSILALPANSPCGAPAGEELKDRPQPLEKLLAAGRSSNQEIALASERVLVADIAIRLGEGPSAVRGAGDARAGGAAGPESSVETRVRSAEARRELASAQARTDAAVIETSLRADRARRALRTLARDVLPGARLSFELVRDRYTAGNASFIEWLEISRACWEAPLRIEESHRDLYLALLDLDDALGESAAAHLSP